MKKLEEDPRIPRSFRNGTRPLISTVGELKQELAELPDDLLIDTGFYEFVQVCVMAYNNRQFRMSLEEVDPED